MATTDDRGAGRWIGFTQYEIIDGGIQPTRSAEMVSRSPWFQRRGDPPSYQTLANLVRGLAEPLDKEGEAQLLAWITKHGVLGVLPHETLAVSLWPRWARAFEHRKPGEQSPLLPTVTTYYRDGGVFHWQRRAFDPTLKITAAVERHGRANLDGEPVTDRLVLDELKRHGWSEPEVVRLPVHVPDESSARFGGALVVVEPLGRAWGRYFLKPTVPERSADKWRYPEPCSADFWHSYVEPLSEFLAAARQLCQGLKDLAGAPHGYEQSGGPALSRLFAPMGLDLVVVGQGRLQEGWRGPSLLSMLAAMAALDATRGGLRVCRCGNVIVSQDERVEYCSPKCRWRYHQRAYRARKRARSQGETTSSRAATTVPKTVPASTRGKAKSGQRQPRIKTKTPPASPQLTEGFLSRSRNVRAAL